MKRKKGTTGVPGTYVPAEPIAETAPFDSLCLFLGLWLISPNYVQHGI